MARRRTPPPPTATAGNAPPLTTRELVALALLAREGCNDRRLQSWITEARGGTKYFDADDWTRIVTESADLAFAVAEGRRPYSSQPLSPQRRTEEDFSRYLVGHLPEDLRTRHEELLMLDDLGGKDGLSLERVQATLQGIEVADRQRLFLHVLMTNEYNVNKAARRCGLSIAEISKWEREDEMFGKLLFEVQQLKKNFFESALIDRIANGDTQAILFANRTLNKDRGYSERVEVAHSGTVRHEHTMVDISTLGLPLDIMVEILDAVEARKAEELSGKKPGNRSEIIIDIDEGDATSTQERLLTSEGASLL